MFNGQSLLIITILFPIFGILVVLFIPSRQEKLLKIISLIFACLPFTSSLILWRLLKNLRGSLQFVTHLFYIFSVNISLGVDELSLFLISLTTLLVILCLLINWNSVRFNLKEFLIAFLFLDFLLIGSFSVLIYGL
jgi:NADH:ubiquinone oxidoreductase subunit 4 (subunit M)